MSALRGRRIVVTRRAGQSGALVRLLQERGARVVELPAIEIGPPADLAPLDLALGSLERFEWVVFTSANAVQAVAERMAALGRAPRLTHGRLRVASAGAATTAALRAAFPADPIALQPAADFGATALALALEREGVAGARILYPASSRARQELPRELRARDAIVELVVAYETVEPPDLAVRVNACLDGGLDLALFASPSAVQSLAAAAGERARGLPSVAIGATTAEAVRAAGLDLRGIAEPATAEGLVRAAERALAAEDSSRC